MTRLCLIATLIAGASFTSARAQALSPLESRIRAAVAAHYDSAVGLLQRTVDIPSGTLNLAGVRAVGQAYQRELTALGFTTRWAAMPASLGRAGHLVAEWRGPQFATGGKRILLIGHLDTVFEGQGQRFVQRDSVARGAGAADMKGGNVAMILALQALKQAGALDQVQVIVVMTGDEESAGRPLSVSRKDLLDAARRSDVALAFEGGDARTATIARRGASGWILTVRGRQGHSSAIFRDGSGYGAIFEAARILNEFRERLSKQPYLTFNPGTIVGGTDVSFDSTAVSGKAASKTNIIAKHLVVQGDLRSLTPGQLDSARTVMREIIANNLPGTTATISFEDGYPGMPPTDGNRAILAIFDRVSQDLGYPAIEALPPERRGAGDVSFVAPIIDAIDGLGVEGFGAHAPEEGVYLPSLKMAAERAAVLMFRLSRPARPATSDQ
ncbi:MAG: M20/M25/M40 family metallo-hydrolase [Gemmatimonadetes bacterium]|nr:M20/M25/M40 family metallo-hydrolase [Gemmatimonadota bacterium]